MDTREPGQTTPTPRLILLDVDGTLTRTLSGATFRKRADDWALLPGRAAQCAAWRQLGAALALVTNQGGVAFGYLPERAVRAELDRLADEVGAARVYACFHHPAATLPAYKGDHPDRKPNPGMLLAAMADFDVAPQQTLLVGDRDEDRDAARAAGCAYGEAAAIFGIRAR